MLRFLTAILEMREWRKLRFSEDEDAPVVTWNSVFSYWSRLMEQWVVVVFRVEGTPWKGGPRQRIRNDVSSRRKDFHDRIVYKALEFVIAFFRRIDNSRYNRPQKMILNNIIRIGFNWVFDAFKGKLVVFISQWSNGETNQSTNISEVNSTVKSWKLINDFYFLK